MLIVSCYGCMILTSWGSTDGSPASASAAVRSSDESMWLKITSQWIFFGLYLKVLQVAYSEHSSEGY